MDGLPLERHALDEPIGQLIRRARHKHGLSQYQLAEELAAVSDNASIVRQHVARWERGTHVPGPYWRDWLCKELCLSRDQVESAVRATKLRNLMP